MTHRLLLMIEREILAADIRAARACHGKVSHMRARLAEITNELLGAA